MSRLLLSDSELTQLVNSVVRKGGCDKIGRLIAMAPEFETFASLMPYEKYFCKRLAYQDFEVHFAFFEADGDTVNAADIQFKRASRWRWGLMSPSRGLVLQLRKLLSKEYKERGIAIKDETGGRRIYFKVVKSSGLRGAGGQFDESVSECSIYDEPRSSGQTDPAFASLRNDFVIFRFRRKT